MERITRTLERAHAQRIPANPAGLATVASANHAVAGSPSVEFTETAMFRTPAIEFDAAVRSNERILPPGATGPHGAAYKILRTQVLRRLDAIGATTLGVMSARSGAGRTLTAINLAIAVAADPARTALLIDFDLRNPQVHRRFRHEPSIGIEECIEQRLSMRDAMFKVAGYERLTIAASRSQPEQSSELLASTRVAEAVEEMRTRYSNRIVIFDLPPVLETDDALGFARHLQAGLLVVGEGTTQRQDVARTLNLLGDLTFVGTVLNGSKHPSAA